MRRRMHIGTFFRRLFLILGGLISLFPFYWMFVLASRPSSVIYKYPPVLIPGRVVGSEAFSCERVQQRVNPVASLAGWFQQVRIRQQLQPPLRLDSSIRDRSDGLDTELQSGVGTH